MAFQSFSFLVFFLVVLILARGGLQRRPSLKKDVLLIASYYFYMSWDWRFAGLILTITLINFALGPRIYAAQSKHAKAIWLTLSLVTSLGILAYFKYANFFIDSLNELLIAVGVGEHIGLISVLLPVGISFYTFQSISYVLDIHQGRTKPIDSLRDFALFVAFFPQLVAGPIVRATYFLPQLREDYQERNENPVETGMALILRGFIKKIAIADVLGFHIVDPAFANPGEFSPLFLLIALYAYSYQVYMDFSGYTDIARGVARTLGYDLPINFNRPYLATSIGNFWQRWHISMSSFFRDYLFYGLGGSKKGNVYFNLLITFVAIGIWHGAGWNFVLYGLCHGTLVAIERWRFNRRKALGLPPIEYRGFRLIWQVFIIFNIVALLRVLFRGGTLDAVWSYLAAMTNFANTAIPLGPVGLSVLAAAIVLHYTPAQWSDRWERLFCLLPAPVQAVMIVVTVYGLIALSSGTAPFMYFQF